MLIEIKEISEMQKDIKEIKEMLTEQKTIPIEERPVFVDKKYLVENYNLKMSFIDKCMKHRDLPYYKVGKKVSFKPVEIEKYIENNKKK